VKALAPKAAFSLLSNSQSWKKNLDTSVLNGCVYLCNSYAFQAFHALVRTINITYALHWLNWDCYYIVIEKNLNFEKQLMF
jgi:hypothetical protein